MLVDGAFMGEDGFFFGAVGDAHDVDVAEFSAAFAPVGVGHDVEAADLLAGLDLAAFGDGPVEKGVEFGDALAGAEGFDVFEEGGEAADDVALVERLRYAIEFVEGDVGFAGTRLPEIDIDFVGFEFTLQGGEDAPIEFTQLDNFSVGHFGQLIRFAAGFHAAAADVADTQGEEAQGGHEFESFGAGLLHQQAAVFFHRETLRDFEGGPEAIFGGGDGLVGGADDDVAGERVV